MREKNSESIFKGRKFRPLAIPTKAVDVDTENRLKFPITVSVVGVTMGERRCLSCGKSVSETNVTCIYCQKNSIVSERQDFLKKARSLNLGIASLVPEPKNPYDSKAVAVYVKNENGVYTKIGYLPAKRKEGEDKLIASEIFQSVLDGVRYWVTGVVTGGPQEDNPNLSYGFRLTIHDRPTIL